MRRAIAAAAVAAILAGPTAIAFFTGGYYDESRLIAAIAAWLLVLAAAVAAERPLPRRWPGRLALLGLAGLMIWSAVSLLWAPLGGPALDDVQRLSLYVAALVAAGAWLRPGGAATAVEPALALGALVVVGYGLSERMLPGVLDFDASRAAGGRLEQPITYWNAMGALAVTGLLLSVRVAGTAARPAWLRAVAVGSCPPLATGLYLTFSRGALAAAAAGALVLLALAPDRPQVRAVGLALATGGLAVALTGLLSEVSAANPGADAGRQGAVLLVGLAALAAGGGLAAFALARRESWGRLGTGPVAGHRVRLVTAGLAAVVAMVAVVAVGASRDGARGADAEGAARLGSLQSNRYEYWSVAASSFANRPLRGVGAAGFRVEWLREREVREKVKDAHSVYAETAAELGLAGLAMLLVTAGGIGVSAVRAYRADASVAVGPVAALTAFAFHAGIDWDWELPAVTLPVLALAGLLMAAGDRGGERPPPPAPRPRES